MKNFSIRIINKTKNTVIAQKAILAKNFFSRLKGLLGKDSFDDFDALIIKPCNSIHTFFMHFPIDVIFLDKSNYVIGAFSIKPWRISKVYFSAHLCIELPWGKIFSTSTIPGDLLFFEDRFSSLSENVSLKF
ncbi:MAG: DUF192 domain-containing protein [Candidatus Omnitrophica bacterium]|nr:DUF192 domain-containing protein [Candidatus Omnitrophota bacterium]